MGTSIRRIIKQILKENEEEEEVSSERRSDSGIDDVMANIQLNNDEIESALSSIGINLDLDKIGEFGSIDRVKAAGVFDFKFVLKNPVSELFGDMKGVETKVIYRESENDTLVLVMESGPYIIFDRKTLVKDIPMGGSSRYSISSLLTKQNEGYLKAPGLVEGEAYTVKFVDGDYESGPVRIKVLDVGFIKKSKRTRGANLPAEISSGQIQIDNDIDSHWTKSVTNTFINTRLKSGNNILRKSKPPSKNEYVIELPSKEHKGVAVVMKPRGSGDFDSKKRWSGEWVNIEVTHRAGGNDIGKSSGKIKLNLD